MLEQMGIAAKAASWQLALLSSREKNQVLEKIADYLEAQTDDILRANAEDLAEARADRPCAEDHRQRQDPAAEHLQYRGNAAGAPQHRRHLPAGVKQADGRERRHPARRPFRPPHAAKRPCESRAGESGAV